MELDLDVEGIERMLLDLTIIPGILLQADIIIMIYFINQLLSVIELTHQRTLTWSQHMMLTFLDSNFLEKCWDYVWTPSYICKKVLLLHIIILFSDENKSKVKMC